MKIRKKEFHKNEHLQHWKSLQKDAETNTKTSTVYNILPDAIKKMQDIGRLDDFCSLIKNVGNGTLDGNIALQISMTLTVSQNVVPGIYTINRADIKVSRICLLNLQLSISKSRNTSVCTRHCFLACAIQRNITPIPIIYTEIEHSHPASDIGRWEVLLILWQNKQSFLKK